MTTQRKSLLDRVRSLEAAVNRANEYLESGKYAHWHGFQPVGKRKALVLGRSHVVARTAQPWEQKQSP